MAFNFNLPSTTTSYANLAAFPATGSSSILYKALNNNKLYTWDGTKYNEVDKKFASSWGSVSAAPETTAITKDEVGLGNVDNTSDVNKPVSTAQATAIALKQDTLTLTTTGSSGAATLSGSTLNIPQYSGGGGGSSNPSVISLSATNGTAVTGTLIETISRSLLIPANTFTTDGMLEVVARVQKTGTLAGHSFRIYKNTSNTLTGATLIGSVLSASTQLFAQPIRTFRINSNTLTGLTTSTITSIDYAQNGNPEASTTFTTSVDNYIIFAIQLAGTSDSSVVRMARAMKYI